MAEKESAGRLCERHRFFPTWFLTTNPFRSLHRTVFFLLSTTLFVGCNSSPPGKVGTQACLGCHNGLTAQNRQNFLESPHFSAGVGCEDCHGGGITHVRYGGSLGLFIDNPARGDFGASYESCVKCHADTVGQFHNSVHGQREIASCQSCHTAHEAESLLLPATNNELCLSCHDVLGFATDAQITAHTFHPVDPEITGASRCIECHMNPTPRFDQESGGRSHDWVPREPIFSNLAAEAGMDPIPPNTCAGIMGCHDGSVSGAPIFDVDSPEINASLQNLFESRHGKSAFGVISEILLQEKP